jgi:hypothetical protein
MAVITHMIIGLTGRNQGWRNRLNRQFLLAPFRPVAGSPFPVSTIPTGGVPRPFCSSLAVVIVVAFRFDGALILVCPWISFAAVGLGAVLLGFRLRFHLGGAGLAG